MPYTITHFSSPTLLSYIEFRMFLKIHTLLPQRSLKETNLILELSILKLFLRVIIKYSSALLVLPACTNSVYYPIQPYALLCFFFFLVFFFFFLFAVTIFCVKIWSGKRHLNLKTRYFNSVRWMRP